MTAARVEVVLGDITGLEVDAIVNAANTTLLGGGGVDGAIHRRAGGQLLEECRALGGCPTGEARLTGGHGLPAKHVIHAVGPVWRDGRHGEPEKLASAYRSSLELARQHRLASLAFPAISCGAYRYPLEEAVKIAVAEVMSHLETNDDPGRVIFACFDEPTYRAYQHELGRDR